MTTLIKNNRIALLLLALVILILHPALLPEQSNGGLMGRDFVSNFYPLYGYTTEQVLQGEWPLWNPRQFAGFPVAGNPQAAIFYPPTWGVWGLAALGISVPRAMGVMLVLHVWWGAWGMSILVRRYGATALAALVAGLLYATSGWAASRIYAGHYTVLTVSAWIPFILAGYHDILQKRGRGAWLLGIGALGMAALGGHPQLVLYAVLGLGVMWGVQVISADDWQQSAWDGLWRLALMGAAGMLLGMALILPTAELTAVSVRNDTTLDFVNKFHLPAQQWLTLALPFLYGNPNTPPSRYWGGDFFEETTAYIGLLPLVFLFMVATIRARKLWLWWAFIVLGLVMSFGADGVLFALLVRWVPAFDLFRSSGRFLFFVTFGVAGLSAHALTLLATAPIDKHRAMLTPLMRVVPFVVAALVAGSVFFSGWYASASHVEPMPHRAAQVAGVLGYAALVMLFAWGVLHLLRTADDTRGLSVALILAVVLMTWDVWRVMIPLVETRDLSVRPVWNGAAVNVPTDNAGRVKAYVDPNAYDLDPVNMASLTGHLNVEGYDPLEIATYAALHQAAGSEPTNPFYHLLGLRYLLTWEPRDELGWQLIGIADGGIYYENPAPHPRAWVAVEGILQPDDAIARDLIVRGELDSPRQVILSAPLDCDLGDTPTTADIIDYRANDITLQVKSDGGVLVLSDQYYNGWQAWIDDSPVPIVRANTMMRAVCMPAGDHSLRFAYRPLSVMVGAGLSGIGWLVFGIIGITSWTRKEQTT